MNIGWKSLVWSLMALMLLLSVPTPLNAVTLFLLMTPFVILFSEKLVTRFLGLTKKVLPVSVVSPAPLPGETKPPLLENHLVIIGYGINGRNLARAAQLSGIPFIVLELNPETVKAEKQLGLCR